MPASSVLRSFLLSLVLIGVASGIAPRGAYANKCDDDLTAKEHRALHEPLQSAAERALLTRLETDPEDFFFELRNEAMEHLAHHPGASDFPLKALRPSLDRMVSDLEYRLLAKQGNEQTQAAFQAALAKGRALQADANAHYGGRPLYKATVRYSEVYLEAIGHLLLENFPFLAPEITEPYHQNHAEHVQEEVLGDAPDQFMLPTFESVGANFFAAGRSAPVQILWINTAGLEAEPIKNIPSGMSANDYLLQLLTSGTRTFEQLPPFADGFFMTGAECRWHDLGHIEFIWDRDRHFLDNTFKPIERVVQEWGYSRLRIKAFWDSFSEDPDLYDAIGMLLFEILHERGYQYSLSVLKTQLDTPKWIEILTRKLDNGYFSPFAEVNLKLFPQLERARSLLVRHLGDLRRMDQLQHLDWLHAETTVVSVTHYPAVEYGQGRLRHIEITPSGETIEARGESGQIYRADIKNVLLAQVAKTRHSPFDEHAMTAKINAVIQAGAERAPIHWKETNRLLRLIRVDLNRRVTVVFDDGTEAPIDEITVDDGYRSAEPRLLERHFFQLNQVLGSEDARVPLSFTLHRPTVKYLGTVKLGLQNGLRTLTVRRRDPATGQINVLATLPLSEVLVDPMTKEDVVPSPRKPRPVAVQ